jgi:hypothetical protein
MGKKSRSKGYRGENNLVNWFKSLGLRAERVPLSGATDYAKGDVDLYLEGRDAPLVGEVKLRAKFPKAWEDWLGENDFLYCKADRKEPFVVLPMRTFEELITK